MSTQTYLTGLVRNVFVRSAYTNKQTGEMTEARAYVQFETVEKIAKSSDVVICIENVKTKHAADFRKYIGQTVCVPVEAWSRKDGGHGGWFFDSEFTPNDINVIPSKTKPASVA